MVGGGNFQLMSVYMCEQVVNEVSYIPDLICLWCGTYSDLDLILSVLHLCSRSSQGLEDTVNPVASDCHSLLLLFGVRPLLGH